MNLLQHYKSRFGDAVKRQGNGWNGPCPLCGGEPGKSDRFVVWPDRSDRLGKVCSEHGISGIWSCRQCGASGDTIAYLEKIEGLDFKTSLSELGIQPDKRPFQSRKAPAEPVKTHPVWQPREFAQPSQQWLEHSLKLVEEAEKAIWDYPQAIAWLNNRGLDEAAIRACRIGYLAAESEKYAGRFRPRKSFGLPPKQDKTGASADRLYIPRGIVIPSFGPDLFNLRIRRHKADLKAGFPKYMELEGSWNGPLRLKPDVSGTLACYFVTEAELDAILIHCLSGGRAGAIAVRTNRGKPDNICHALLKASARICVALDYDEAGAAGVDFWEQTYSQSVRWPTPEGKDPGDAWELGVDLLEWIRLGLPACCAMPEAPEPEEFLPAESMAIQSASVEGSENSGLMDACLTGQNNLGERGRIFASMEKAEHEDGPRFAQADDFSPEELGSLRTVLPFPSDLETMFLEVAQAWLLWRDLPVTFHKNRSESGQIDGWVWKWSRTWQEGHQAEFDRFWRFQEGKKDLFAWLMDHPADEINADNLLHLYELPGIRG